MINTMANRIGSALVATFVLTACNSVFAQHAHDHGGVPDMDENGRRLDSYDMQHDISDEQMAALREKIALYRALTDREVHLNMALMGPNYEWYVSNPEMLGDTAVLILSHGVGENSDTRFVESLKPMAERWPTAIAFGMNMMTSGPQQSAIDDLAARGATTIVLVPTVVSPHNTLIRQWEYIYGMRDEHEYLAVAPVNTNAQVLMAKSIDDHPLITEALLDFTNTKSTNPANEVVIIVGHGPEDIEDNEPDLALLQKHADRIKLAGQFNDVKVINLQDDAYPPIRKSNVKKLRRWITSAQRSGKDVIVTVITSASDGVQNHIREDLRGLNYAFAEQGLSEHANYLKWIEATVEERLATAAK